MGCTRYTFYSLQGPIGRFFVLCAPVGIVLSRLIDQVGFQSIKSFDKVVPIRFGADGLSFLLLNRLGASFNDPLNGLRYRVGPALNLSRKSSWSWCSLAVKIGIFFDLWEAW